MHTIIGFLSLDLIGQHVVRTKRRGKEEEETK